MKIASWNVNSLRMRFPQLMEWLKAAHPDVVCLQETKVTDEEFPAWELSVAGYESAFWGEAAYNGVAILSREPLADIKLGLPREDSPGHLSLHQSEGQLYGYWDYRTGAFRRNEGWRLGLILATRPLAQACTAAWIDLEPRRRDRPSDHTPVLAEFRPVDNPASAI